MSLPGWFAAAMAVTMMAPPVSGAPSGTPAPNYDDYRAAVMGFVDPQGRVDYAGLKDQRVYIDDFAVYLERLDPKTYGAWSDADKIAFWINAYNALTLRAIIDHYPINPATPNGSYPKNSIRQIPGVWDVTKVRVMGQEVTLQYIETKFLRRDFHEPRIHMALVCAAVSCPKLRTEPYEGARLETQLADQTRAFLSDPRHFRIDRAKKTVRASEIFHWYADDFAPASVPRANSEAVQRSALVAFVSPYLSESDRAFLANPDCRIEYTPYDWSLNEQPK